MQVKVRFFFVFIAVVCIMHCLSAIAETNQSVLRLQNDETISVLCNDDESEGGFYVLTNQRLFHYDGTLTNITDIVSEVSDLVGIAAGNGSLYAMNRNHELLFWDGEVFRVLFKNTLANGTMFRCKMSVSQSNVFYSWKDEKDRIHLYAIDISGSQAKELKPAADQMFVYDMMGNLLVSMTTMESDGELAYGLIGYDYENDIFSQPERIEGLNDTVRGWTYDSKHNIYYICTRSETLRYQRGKRAERFCSDSSGIIAALGNDHVALIAATDGIWEVRVCGAEHTSKTLTVMNYDTKSNTQFTKQYDIAVETVYHQGDTTLWDVSQAMTTQDGSVDIFGIRTDEGISLLKEKGYYVDLRKSDILCSSLEELYPAFRTAVETSDKAIAAWPVYAEPMYRMVETELLADYGFSSPQTWMELLDVVPQIIDSELLTNEDCTLFDTLTWTKQDIFPYFIDQYVLAAARKGIAVDFDTEAFRMTAQRILSELTYENPIPTSEDGEETVLFSMSCLANVIQPDMLPPLALTTEDEAGIYTSAMLLVINPYSEHQDEAIAYLEYLSKRKEEIDFGLYASMTQPKENASVVSEITKMQEQLNSVTDSEQKVHLEGELARLERARYTVSSETISNYQQLAQQFVVPEDILPTKGERLCNLIQRTLFDHLALNDFISQANEYFRMIDKE